MGVSCQWPPVGDPSAALFVLLWRLVQIYYEEPHLSWSQPGTIVTHEALQLIHHVAPSPEMGYLHLPLL